MALPQETAGPEPLPAPIPEYCGAQQAYPCPARARRQRYRLNQSCGRIALPANVSICHSARGPFPLAPRRVQGLDVFVRGFGGCRHEHAVLRRNSVPDSQVARKVELRNARRLPTGALRQVGTAQAPASVTSGTDELHIRVGVCSDYSDRNPFLREYQVPIHDAESIGADVHRLIIRPAHAPNVLIFRLRHPGLRLLCFHHACPLSVIGVCPIARS